MKKKPGITRRTRSKHVRQFAMLSTSAFRNLNDFVDANCKWKTEQEREAVLDEIGAVVDAYVEVNCKILLWCHKNGVDPCDFVCDVYNQPFANLDKDKKGV